MSVSNREGLQFKIRLTEDMKSALAALSDGNNRSMTAEILVAIEKHLASNGVEVPQPKPTGHNSRLDTFVAAALTGLITRGAASFPKNSVCIEAHRIGSLMLKSMEEIEREDYE